MFKVRDAANHIWLELYLACIEDRVIWRGAVKLDNLPELFPALRDNGIKSRNLMIMGVEDLAKEQIVSISADDFDERYVGLTEEGFVRAEAEIEDPSSRIGRIFASRAQIQIVSEEPGDLPSALEEDAWEPIAVDRSATSFTDAMTSLEAVRDQFRQENGYASQEPEKKAALLDAIDKGIDILRSKVLTRATVELLVFRPLYSIVQIFGKASIGEAARLAIGAVRAWLNL